jgi:hypothetical protein
MLLILIFTIKTHMNVGWWGFSFLRCLGYLFFCYDLLPYLLMVFTPYL